MIEDKVCLLDGDIILYTTCFANTNVDDFYYVKYNFISNLVNILANNETDKYIGFLTSKRNFRKDIVTDRGYKANRKGKEKPKWFYELKDWITEELGFITIDKLEADDCLSIMNNVCSNGIIVSTDKDLLQIEGNHYNPKSSRLLTIDSDTAKRNLWIQVLMGDSTDNVAGIKGVGPKNADRMLCNCPFRDSYETKALEEYIKAYGEYLGVELFYKTYVLVKLLEEHENLDPTSINVRSLDYTKPIENFVGEYNIEIDGRE